MIDPVTDLRSALDRLIQNHKDVQSLEREVKRLTDARSTLLMEARQLQEFILASGDAAIIDELRGATAFRNTMKPQKVPRPIEEKEILAILRAFRARKLTEADVIKLAQDSYVGRPIQAHRDALNKLLQTGEVIRTPEGGVTFGIPFHLM